VEAVIVPIAERPDLRGALFDDALDAAWPTFMLNDPVANLYYAFERLDRFLDFVLVAFDPQQPQRVLARAMSVPFCFGEGHGRSQLPKGGWDQVVLWSEYDQLAGRSPNAVSALEIVVDPEVQGRGLSGRLLKAMATNAARLGFADLYASIRPSHKHLEPHAPMVDYVQRTRADGLPADPWLRVHVRAGGEVVSIAPRSMTISGTLTDWRLWTGLPFDRSGPQVVPGALVPVLVSLEHDYAVYVEPNVWMHHRL
jgi:GNAT superfamily N-acetyltransferase